MKSDTLKDLSGFDSATIANAIERFDVRDRLDGYASLDLRCQFPELPPVVGHAVTCVAESTTSTSEESAGWGTLLDEIESSPKPAIVVIAWRGPDSARGCVVGDMVATALTRLGVVGIICDSAIRDRSGIRRNAPTMQLFARGTVASHGRAHIVDVGALVNVGGLEVTNGAILHGDENGIVDIPPSISDELAAVAGQVRSEEQAYFAALSSPTVGFAEIRDWLEPHS